MQINPNSALFGTFLFEVKNSNPNGDPQANNAPRQDDEGRGIVTDVCQKRKIRDYLADYKQNDLFIARGSRLDKTMESVENLNQLLDAFIDVRLFGGVITKYKAQLRGPIQFRYAESITPVVCVEDTITRCARQKGKDQSEEDAGEVNQNMGGKNVVRYGLYRGAWHYNPIAGRRTNVTEQDLSDFIEAWINMFAADQSASRTNISMIKGLIFESPGDESKPGFFSVGKHGDIKRLMDHSLQVSAKNDEPSCLEDFSIETNLESLEGLNIYDAFSGDKLNG